VFILIVGAGRVGSTVAKWALAQGHEVSVLDEDLLSHERLDQDGRDWEDAGGRFTVGTALETDGDNTNLVIAQIAQRRFNVPRVIARVLDPLRAEWYREQGLETICPTRVAIEQFEQALSTA
jgi:trk system potassium uptake protein TrkA